MGDILNSYLVWCHWGERVWSKMTCESCVVVWDNGRRDSMKTEYLVHENLCEWGGGIWMVESTQMSIFGDPFNHNQYYDLPSRFRDPFNEIHRSICPNPYRDGKGFKQSRKECHFTLVELEGITFIHPLLNFPFHSLPKEVTHSCSYVLRNLECPADGESQSS